MTPADVYDTQVGHIWGIVGTRDYIKARDDLSIHEERFARSMPLRHPWVVPWMFFTLNRSGGMGFRHRVALFFLSLGRDQDCYDFVKWYQPMGKESDYD